MAFFLPEGESGAGVGVLCRDERVEELVTRVDLQFSSLQPLGHSGFPVQYDLNEASVSRNLQKDHAKMQRCLPWFFRTEPESEDFVYWDGDGMKVLHCDHTFELRLQESSLLLHQEGQGRRSSSLIGCFESSYWKGCHVALHEGNNWNFARFMHPQLCMKRFFHVRVRHFLDLLGHVLFFCILPLEQKWQVKKIYGKMRMKFSRLVHPALCFPS